jgi:hypothetical protein
MFGAEDEYQIEIEKLKEELTKAKKEIERLGGIWHNMDDNCPQCGTANYNLTNAKVENHKLREGIMSMCGSFSDVGLESMAQSFRNKYLK